MANGFAEVHLAGNMTADPETRFAKSGVQVTSFCVAVNKYVKDGEDKVSFIEVVTFNKTAEFVGKYFQKGDSIRVMGELEQSTWEDSEGKKRSKIKVIANKVDFFGWDKKKEEEPDLKGQEEGFLQTGPNKDDMDEFVTNKDVPDDDIPF